MRDKICMFLGLARKANVLVLGEEGVEKAICRKKTRLVVLASDASDNTKKGIVNMCERFRVSYRVFGMKEVIGEYLGKGNVAVIGVKNKGFAKRLVEMIDDIKK